MFESSALDTGIFFNKAMTPSSRNNDDSASILSDASLRFLPAQVGDTEDLELYRKGGLHPVHLGDHYDGNRYRIVHKLGAGGFSTVWLAYDTSASSWVALKIIVADKSAAVEEKALMCHRIISGTDASFVTFTRCFHIDGPNGRHLCLVIPFLGPSLHTLSHFLMSRIHPWLVRRLAAQIVQATAELHSHGLCHGDLAPSNIVFRIQNLDHLDDDGVYRLFGTPKTGRLETCSSEIPGPEAPRYIVGYLDFLSSEADILTNEICFIDCDQAFLASAPPSTLETPIGFLAPEVAVGRPASQASDIWALGCTILHLRAGFSPFYRLDIDCPANLLTSVMQYFGDIPTSWGNPLFDCEGQPTIDETEGSPLTEFHTEKLSLRKWISNIWDQPPTRQVSQSTPPPDLYDENKPYPDCYEKKFWKPAAIQINSTYLDGYCDEVDKIIESLPKISDREVDLLHDLLSKILMYEPSQRLSASDILAHPWFQMDG